MLIRFKKGKNQYKHKPDTITCFRKDGSITWTHIHQGFIHHDFAHYVVETTLNYKNAFFGLVSQGYSIADFSLPTHERPFKIPKEALEVEPIVALLQAEFRSQFQNSFLEKDSKELPSTTTPEEIHSMRQHLHKLMTQWDDLQAGEYMELKFNVF